MKRIRLLAGLLSAAGSLIAMKLLNGVTWYSVKSEDVTINIEGQVAWPSFTAILCFQALAVLLGLYFRKAVSVLVLSLNLVVSAAFWMLAFNNFQNDLPGSIEAQVAKQTGVIGELAVTHSDFRFWFLGIELFVLVLIALVLWLRISEKQRVRPAGKYERIEQGKEASDPISLWDSQR